MQLARDLKASFCVLISYRVWPNENKPDLGLFQCRIRLNVESCSAHIKTRNSKIPTIKKAQRQLRLELYLLELLKWQAQIFPAELR